MWFCVEIYVIASDRMTSLIQAKGPSWPGTAPSASRGGRSAFTLVELLAVLAILIVVAGVVLNASSIFKDDKKNQTDTGKTLPSPQMITTQMTMRAIADSIHGTDRIPGYVADMHAAPTRIADLLRKPDGAQDYDVQTRTGWRGPYFLAPTAPYVPGKLSPGDAYNRFGCHGLIDGIDVPGDPYGCPNDPAVLDGWGQPIVLQFPDPDGSGPPVTADEAPYVRLVSAGPDGTIQTPRTGADARIPTLVECGDDLVLFLRMVDPRR